MFLHKNGDTFVPKEQITREDWNVHMT